jgi:nitroreductase
LSPTQELLAARYALPHDTHSAVAAARHGNAVIDAMLDHRSVRGYRPDPLAPGQLDLILAAAQSAASSSNLQTYSIIVVEDAARKATLAELAGGQKHIAECPAFLLFAADLSRLNRIADARAMPHAGNDHFEMFLVAAIDAALAGQNACVAAESLGLGTVYIGAMRNRPEEVAAALQLPPAVAVVFGLCIGHPAPGAEGMIKPRLPRAAVVHREVYSTLPEQAAVDHTNGAMARFYEVQKMAVKGVWAEHSARRVAGPEQLSGRDRLLKALKGMGFMARE